MVSFSSCNRQSSFKRGDDHLSLGTQRRDLYKSRMSCKYASCSDLGRAFFHLAMLYTSQNLALPAICVSESHLLPVKHVMLRQCVVRLLIL